MDKISIVVAVYNAEKTLKKCIESLLNQTYENTEIILVNDCSKDNSLDICIEYSKNYDNVKVISNERNSGVSAINKTMVLIILQENIFVLLIVMIMLNLII